VLFDRTGWIVDQVRYGRKRLASGASAVVPETPIATACSDEGENRPEAHRFQPAPECGASSARPSAHHCVQAKTAGGHPVSTLTARCRPRKEGGVSLERNAILEPVVSQTEVKGSRKTSADKAGSARIRGDWQIIGPFIGSAP